jgi:hypothetical protein
MAWGDRLKAGLQQGKFRLGNWQSIQRIVIYASCPEAT